MQKAIINDEFSRIADGGNLRAQLVSCLFLNSKSYDSCRDKENRLFQYLLHHRLITQNRHAEALRFLKLSAQKGCAAAIAHLGGAYHTGYLGLTKNSQEALKLAQEAVEKKSLLGVWILGMVSLGNFLNSQWAFEHFSRAAQFGYPHGEFYLAFMFENGIGTPTDKSKARDLYSKAKHSFEKTNNRYMIDKVTAALARCRPY